MADINVLMMGGRRTGKTSVLAAMDSCCNSILSSVENLSVLCTEGGSDLTVKKNELKMYFTEKYMRRKTFVADIAPTDAQPTYKYEVRVNARDVGYSLMFQDFPGEFFARADKQSWLQEQVNESQIIIITIDTPHLVEDIDKTVGVGKAHASFNRVDEITHFFKTAFQSISDSRLIIFTPLKCEKYFYRNRMGEVNRLVKQGYGELFDFLSAGGVNDICTVAIAPILTLGGAEFFKFGDDGYAGIYNYVQDAQLCKYNPMYCEQPLFLTLQYLISMAKKQSESQNAISRWFQQKFMGKAKLDDLKNCERIIKNNLCTDASKGFEIVQDPLGMKW